MRRELLRFAALASVAVVIVACGSSAVPRSESGYCTKVGGHLAELNAPNVGLPAEVTSTLKLYSSIAAIAPLAIESEWNRLVGVLQTASSVVPADPASVQHAADAAREGQQAYSAIAEYTSRLCGVQLGGAPSTTTEASPSTTS